MTGHLAHTGLAHVLHMAAMGLVVSTVAPMLLAVLLRVAPRWDRYALPAAIALPAFVALHAAVTLRHVLGWPAAELPSIVVLLCGSLLFWAPVLGVRRRLPDTLRTLYLYAAMPLLDLPGVWLVAVGDHGGGIAMIVGMLPVGLAAAVLTWHWVRAEERRASEVAR